MQHFKVFAGGVEFHPRPRPRKTGKFDDENEDEDEDDSRRQPSNGP
jgi:hypothetical protein